MQDSNLRPLGPKPSALPSCANHRHLLKKLALSTGADITYLPVARQTLFIKKSSFAHFYIILIKISVILVFKTDIVLISTNNHQNDIILMIYPLSFPYSAPLI